MKLRIKGNSIRLRLGRSEVAQLMTGGVVAEATSFDLAGSQRLEYRLVATPEVSSVVASFEAGRIVVRLPVELAMAWGTRDQVGIAATQPTSTGGPLRILIEKDLECLDAPPEESQADTFSRLDEGLACGPRPLVGDPLAR